MSSKIEREAADFAPGTKTYQLATQTSSTRIQVPTEMRDTFVAFQARGEDVFIRFGDSNVTCNINDVSTVSSEVLTEDAQTPHLHVPAGQMRSFRIESSKFTHFAHRAADTDGYFIFGKWTGSGTT